MSAKMELEKHFNQNMHGTDHTRQRAHCLATKYYDWLFGSICGNRPYLNDERISQIRFHKLFEMEAQAMELYEKTAGGDMKSLEMAARYQEQLEAHDFYSIDTAIERVANGLGLLAIGLDRPIAEMSGGQRAKVILAKLLLEKPDVLLLDEPTNFLDKDHVTWLAEYLSTLENAFLVVSHDFNFLDKIANRICDIDNDTITKYYGTYSEFSAEENPAAGRLCTAICGPAKGIKKTEEFIRKNIAGRKAKMAQGRQKQLDRMDKMEP